MSTLDWSDLDRRAVDTIRVLAMDAVEKAGNGHPGTAMSLAPAAYLLFQRVMRHDPTDPNYGYMAIGMDLDALEMDAQPEDDITASDSSKALMSFDMANKRIVIQWPDGTTSTFTED